MNNNERKKKLLKARDKKLLEAKQIDAQINQIDAREKQALNKHEAQLQRILGAIVRTKYPSEEQRELAKHIPKRYIKWAKGNFPDLFPLSGSE